jgi:midasin (ATPase involved in ribosome maturation)
MRPNDCVDLRWKNCLKLWANAIDVEQVVLTRNDTPNKNGLASLQGHDFTPYSGSTAWA